MWWVILVVKSINYIIKSLLYALVILFVINYLGVKQNINIPINFITISIVMILKLSGALGLVIFFLL